MIELIITSPGYILYFQIFILIFIGGGLFYPEWMVIFNQNSSNGDEQATFGFFQICALPNSSNFTENSNESLICRSWSDDTQMSQPAWMLTTFGLLLTVFTLDCLMAVASFTLICRKNLGHFLLKNINKKFMKIFIYGFYIFQLILIILSIILYSLFSYELEIIKNTSWNYGICFYLVAISAFFIAQHIFLLPCYACSVNKCECKIGGCEFYICGCIFMEKECNSKFRITQCINESPKIDQEPLVWEKEIGFSNMAMVLDE